MTRAQKNPHARAQDDWTHLESLIRSRKTATARKALHRQLRRAPKGSDAFFRACDGLRRLGLYADALQALNLGSKAGRSPRSTLWLARLLNLSGAPTFARTFLEKTSPRTYEEHKIAANLRLSFYEPARALGCFERMRALDPEPRSYLSRLSLISMSGAFADLSRFSEAHALLDESVSGATEPLLLAIAQQTRGEYLARQGRWQQAREELRAAIERFPPGDRTPDFAMVCKWLGFVEMRLAREERQLEKGRLLMKGALDILHMPDIRPEIWLDALALWASADPKAREQEGFSLLTYPLCNTGYLKELDRPASISVGIGSPRWHIDLGADEFRAQTRRHLGIPLEIRLLALARLAWPHPLNRETAKCLLWPDEAHSYLQLQERLKKLLLRLRGAHSIRIAFKDGWIQLDDAQAAKIAVTVSDRPERPSLLRGLSVLHPSQIESHYQASRTRRTAILAHWKEQGWIRQIGRGPASRYQVDSGSS